MHAAAASAARPNKAAEQGHGPQRASAFKRMSRKLSAALSGNSLLARRGSKAAQQPGAQQDTYAAEMAVSPPMEGGELSAASEERRGPGATHEEHGIGTEQGTCDQAQSAAQSHAQVTVTVQNRGDPGSSSKGGLNGGGAQLSGGTGSRAHQGADSADSILRAVLQLLQGGAAEASLAPTLDAVVCLCQSGLEGEKGPPAFLFHHALPPTCVPWLGPSYAAPNARLSRANLSVWHACAGVCDRKTAATLRAMLALASTASAEDMAHSERRGRIAASLANLARLD